MFKGIAHPKNDISVT